MNIIDAGVAAGFHNPSHCARIVSQARRDHTSKYKAESISFPEHAFPPLIRRQAEAGSDVFCDKAKDEKKRRVHLCSKARLSE
jgi:hypothetical protein